MCIVTLFVTGLSRRWMSWLRSFVVSSVLPGKSWRKIFQVLIHFAPCTTHAIVISLIGFPRTSLYSVIIRGLEVTLHVPALKLKTPWPESASLLYRPSDRRLLVKLVPSFADGGCRMISLTDPYGRVLDFLYRSCYFSFKYLLNFSHENEWIPLQTHYLSKNLVVPGIEPGPLDL
jgi:hypothetical protein